MEPQGRSAARPLIDRSAGCFAAAFLLAALAGPGTATAEPKDPSARRHLEDGQAALARDDYDGAAEHYERALAIEREPKVLYLLGQVEFLRGDCRASVSYFEQVKEFDVGAQVEDAMHPYLVECAERLAEEPLPSVPEPMVPPAEAREPDAVIEPVVRDEPPPARPWYRDPAGGTLVGVGLVGVAVGGGLMIAAQVRQNADAESYGELEDRVPGIRGMRLGGAVSLAIGSALAIGGFVRWGVLASRGKKARSNTAASPWLDERRMGVAVTGRF